VRVTRCGAAEAHSLAEIIATFYAEVTVSAVDASLDGDALADGQIGDAWTEGSDDPGSFMAKDKGAAYGEFAIASV